MTPMLGGRRRRVRGFTPVEILIGMSIGLILLAGLSTMVVGSRQTSRVERQLLEMQSTGRIAMEVIAREIRKAGFRSNRERAMRDIFPAATAPFTAVAGVVSGSGSDNLSVRFQGTGDAWTADCLGNAVANGQDLWQTLSVTDGELRCRTRNMTAGTDQTLGLIPGVDALSLTYGVDTDGDGFADSYQAAAAVANWATVVSVNVRLRLVSSEDMLTERPQPYPGFDGTAVTPTDRRLRRTFSTVVALRNVLP